jgi:hypothetical protein
VESLWDTFAGGISTIATENSTGVGTYYTGQSADNLFDGSTTTAYSSRGNSGTTSAIAGLNTGFYVTIAQCQSTLVTFRFATTSNQLAARDPIAVTVEGTSCSDLSTCTNWTLLYNGTTGLDNVTNRSTYGPFQSIPSPQSFASYRFLVTAKRNISNFVSYSEVQLYGYT